MVQSMVELVKDLTIALIGKRNISAEDMQETLQKTYATLTALKAQEESGISISAPPSRTAPVEWRKSISKHAITCLECGQVFKQLSIRHLRIHGLDGRSYRMKYAIPATQPLAARSTTDRRRQVVQKIRPWEKAPTYRKSQARHGHPSPEPGAEALPEQTEASVAAAPAQPKQQRNTRPKKKASRQTRVPGEGSAGR